MWCEQALDPSAIETLKLDQRKAQRAILGLAKQDPSILEEVEECEQIMNVIEDNPELQRRVKQYLDTAET